MRTVQRFFAVLTATLMVALGVGIAAASPASAAVWTKAAYAPKNTDSGIEGWADISHKCDDTMGCWSYIKIQYKPDPSPLPLPAWLNSPDWRDVDGHWANQDGWNSVSVSDQGCGSYRTVVDTYNDLPTGSSGISLGIPLGKVEVGVSSNHGSIDRYHATSTSDAAHICADLA